MKHIRIVSFLLLTGVAGMATPSFAQSYGDRALLDKVERMERDLNLLQREFFKNGAAPASAVSSAPLLDNTSINVNRPQENAALGVRLTALEEQLRGLNGRLEESEHRQQQLSEQYTKLEEQIGYLQRSGSAPSALNEASSTKQQPFTNPTAVSSTSFASTNESDPIKQQYDAAFELLKQNKYPEAEVALKNFLAQHEDHALASDSFYWLGEAYYVQKDYEQAAIQFLRGYKKFPKGEKAPDSLLKLAVALGNLEKNKEACTSLGKLNDEFKNASNAIKQRAKEESKRLNCS